MKITNPLVCLDVESTGVWVEKDKIIEIALVKYFGDGKINIFHKKVNPGISIPEVVTDLTGIGDDDVKDAPRFKQIAQEISDFLGGSDFGGFNIESFVFPLLEREFGDAGIKFEWRGRKIYDAQKVFHLNEKRDLTAAYKFYCDKELSGAHSALVDSEAVLEILQKQVERYGEGRDELSVLDQFEYSSHSAFHDAERKFCWWDGKLYLMFGKHARKTPLDALVKTDPGYLSWVLNADFSDNVKTIIRKALKGELPERISK